MEEKPTTAFALSLVGGILELLGGVLLAVWLGALSWFFGGILALFGFYWIILGLIIVLGAILMYNNPSSAHTWGIIILVLSIISGLNIFALIGGILAMTWKPEKGRAAPPPPP